MPKVTLEAFKDVKPLPFTDNVPVVILEAFKDVKPLPFTDNVPVVILEAFKFVNDAPEPEKVAADIFVADIVVAVKIPDNVPPVSGKNNDNVEDIGVPFLYISLRFIFPNASKL